MARKGQARKCSGHKTNGDPCPNWAMRGQEVCHAHGGRAPQAKAAAEERIAIAQAVARFALDLTEITAGDALLRELHRTAAMVEWLSIRVNALPEDDLIWGVDWRRITPASAPGSTPQVVVQQRGRVHPLVVMMERAQVQMRAFADSAHRCGIEDRILRNEELKGAQLAKVVAAILNDPELDMRPEQRAKFGLVVPRHLRAMDGP
jgi:hypothetical protein